MMTAHLRGVEQEVKGIGQGLENGLPNRMTNDVQEEKKRLLLVNKAGESRSPYVRAHSSNPVAWQIWGEETIELARRENRLLFVSIGYSASHWCHVMERESFENEEVAAILNDSFIPVKIDREERPDIDRIYMNFVSATSGEGGWPLNVFVTPDLKPLFGGTYWAGPSSGTTLSEDQLDFIGILNKLSTAWTDQEDLCREDSLQILDKLKEFAAEGTLGDKLSEGGSTLEIELLEDALKNYIKTFDMQNTGFGTAPKFPTPSKLSFLLRLGQYPEEVQDVIGKEECNTAQEMAITTLRKMARSGLCDHIGYGFSRYSVTADWSLPHFEKMLYDNAQLLHLYVDACLVTKTQEFVGAVYGISQYLLTTLAHPDGGFYASEDSDSLYKKGDSEKREGAFYVWTKREFESVLDARTEPVLSEFFNVSEHGNVAKENDPHDEFIDQNVLAISKNAKTLASTYGMKVEEISKILLDGKAALLAHREKERIRPVLDNKIITGWNGLAIGALARTAVAFQASDAKYCKEHVLPAAVKTATFIRDKLYDESSKTLYRIWRDGRGDTKAFADDYAFLIDGLIDLHEATSDEKWLQWADDLQQTQLTLFYDFTGTGAFFSTPSSAKDIILRLKDGMDGNEPSTNGISASNLYRLSALCKDSVYEKRAKETIMSFESEVMQYPWLFPSFAPGIVAGVLGVGVSREGGGKVRGGLVVTELGGRSVGAVVGVVAAEETVPVAQTAVVSLPVVENIKPSIEQ